MDIYLKNPSTPEFHIDSKGIEGSYSSQQITDQFRSREGTLTLPRQIPIMQFAEIRLVDGGQTVFRGYAEQYDISSSREKKISFQGIEKLLEYRYTPDYFYPEGTKFVDLLSDSCTLSNPPGLLAMANGLIPPGWSFSIYDYDKNIIKLTGCGAASRFGHKDLYYIDYKYLKELALVHDVGELAYIDATYYRSTADLYIRIDHDYSRGWYDRGGVICENVFDTKIRLGDCPDDTLDGNLVLTSLDSKIADVITDTLASHGYYLHFRDESDALYLDITDSVGS